jgi:hypothetical protein
VNLVDEHDQNQRLPQTSRREFATAMGMLAASSLLPEASLPAAPGKRMDVGEALMDIVRVRYGQYLRDEQLKDLEQRLRQQLLIAELMKQSKLKNSEEPAFVFRADVP